MFNPLTNVHVIRAIDAGYVRDDIDNDVRETRSLCHFDRVIDEGEAGLIFRLWNEDQTEGVRIDIFPERTACFTIEPDRGAIVGEF